MLIHVHLMTKLKQIFKPKLMLFSRIIAEVKSGKLLLLGSDILDFEVDNVFDEEKRVKISSWQKVMRVTESCRVV